MRERETERMRERDRDSETRAEKEIGERAEREIGEREIEVKRREGGWLNHLCVLPDQRKPKRRITITQPRKMPRPYFSMASDSLPTNYNFPNLQKASNRRNNNKKIEIL